jgi:hypothetical protein
MSKRRLNLVGQTFGQLKVVSLVEPMVGNTRFICVCECGATSVVAGSDLRSGNTKSCGCVKRTIGFMSNLRHGAASKMTGAYRSWRSMKQRCTNPSSRGWADYGALGVTVCNRWLESFDNFLADMGERPEGYSLERIDVLNGYAPNNCKWIPLPEQSKNKRNTIRYKFGDEIFIQSDLARRLKLHPSSLLEMRRNNRLPAGVQALTL